MEGEEEEEEEGEEADTIHTRRDTHMHDDGLLYAMHEHSHDDEIDLITSMITR